VLFEASGDSSEVLNLVEEALDGKRCFDPTFRTFA
jgi:hypothetical protein